MKCSVVTTTNPDIAAALDGLAERLQDGLGGASPDLLLVFFTPHHGEDAELIRTRLLARLSPRVLLGCPAAGVIGEHAEIESGAGLSLWGASWPGAELDPFVLGVDDGDEAAPRLVGWPAAPPAGAAFVLLVDPYTTPADDLLDGFRERYPGAPVVGGMASGSSGPGEAKLLTNDGVLDEGAIGVAIGGSVRLDTVVSQGCRPVGHHFVITKAERNFILGLGGKPALAQLQGMLADVDVDDRHLMQSALHVGRVVDERKSHFERGDFLVRNVLGIEPKQQAIAINDFVRAGQTIQFMVRDAQAASDELSQLMAAEEGKDPPLGALLFSCNGRGSRLFGRPHHDLAGIHEHVGDVPTAGFFAAGEIGPVGGVPFLHGFTASIALFRERHEPPSA